jgi:hypothetical protein
MGHRQHPAFQENQRFGKALYELYLAPIVAWTPPKRIKPLRSDGPTYEPKTLGLHVLGDVVWARLLHLIVETRSSPGYVLVQGLGISTNGGYGALIDLERYGIILRRFEVRHLSEKRVSVHLNRKWPPHAALYGLLKRLNSWMPEYEQIADAVRSRTLNIGMDGITSQVGHEKRITSQSTDVQTC